jgi:hypothetical protein
VAKCSIAALVCGRRKVVCREGGHHIVRRLHLRAARPPTAAEMRELHAGIEQVGRLAVAEHRRRHRAADVGGMHAGMDCILGRNHAAHRDRARRCAGRAGIGHHGAGRDGRHAHQLAHVLLDGRDVGFLVRVLGADVEPVREIAAWAQAHGRDRVRRERVDRGAHVVALGGGRVRGRNGGREPGPGLVAHLDQGLSGDHRVDIVHRTK